MVRSSFYSWFGPALEAARADLRERALAAVRSEKLDLPGVLGRTVRDWHLVDSSSVALSEELESE